MNSNSTSHVDSSTLSNHSPSDIENTTAMNLSTMANTTGNLNNDDEPSISENTVSSDKQQQSQFLRMKKVNILTKTIFILWNKNSNKN